MKNKKNKTKEGKGEEIQAMFMIRTVHLFFFFGFCCSVLLCLLDINLNVLLCLFFFQKVQY